MLRPATAVMLAGLAALGTGAHPSWAQQSAAAFQRLWYQAYDEGVRAVQKRDWPTAILLLESAKRGGPAPGRRVVFQGDRVDVFNPDYYLGLAYNASKRYAEAEAAFKQVVDDKLVVRGDKQFDELQRQSALATGERYLADGERAFRSGRFADAESALFYAQAAGLDTDPRVKDLLARLLVEDAKVAASKNANVEQRPLPAGNERIDQSPAYSPPEDPKVVGNESKGPVTEPSKDPTAPPRVASNPSPDGKASDPAGGRTNPVRPPASGRPPAPLTDDEAALLGATAYYQGNYEEAVRILTPAFEAAPPEYRVTFYLACSKAALVASGRADRSTLAEAREMFAYARAGRDLSQHLRLISPRVREMLGDVVATVR